MRNLFRFTKASCHKTNFKKGQRYTIYKNLENPCRYCNVDTKILSKALSIKLKELLPNLMSSEQTAYDKNRFSAESDRLTSDITDICDSKKLSAFIVTMDSEKACDTIDLCFLILVQKKLGFSQNFLNSIETLLKDQKVCIIYGGETISLSSLTKFCSFQLKNILRFTELENLIIAVSKFCILHYIFPKKQEFHQTS